MPITRVGRVRQSGDIAAGMVIDKPWGCEIVLRLTDDQCVKMLRIKKGCRLSLQYHRVKSEKMKLDGGNAFLEIHRDGIIYEHSLEEPVEILPGTIHRVVAVEESIVLEISTPELDDVVRVADDYGRRA